MTEAEQAKLRHAINLLLDILGMSAAESAAESLPPESDATMLDSPTVAKKLGVSLTYVYRCARAGKLVGVRLGQTWRFRPTDVEAFLRANQTERGINMMKRVLSLVFCASALMGCSGNRDFQKVTPGARVIYHGGKFAVWTICDRGNRVYMTEESSTVAVVAGGCPDGQP
jgi:excisionase family DNA binding protein